MRYMINKVYIVQKTSGQQLHEITGYTSIYSTNILLLQCMFLTSIFKYGAQISPISCIVFNIPFLLILLVVFSFVEH